jgi:hypothetical protein
MVQAVQRYQIARMRATHEALLRAPGYGPLCAFFLTDLYGSPEVGAARAADLSRLIDILQRVLPGWVYDGALTVLELYTLSEQLDDRLARMLLLRGARTAFSAAEFESAYFRCDDYADRMRQIELSASSTAFGHALGVNPSVGRLFAAARAVPGLPRVSPLVALLERGHRAANGAGEIGPFIEAMRAGETAYVNGVYARQRG